MKRTEPQKSNPVLQAVAEHVCHGGRLRRPASCPEAVYQVMTACWAAGKDARPAFAHLKQDLQDAFASVTADNAVQAGRYALRA